MVYTFEELKEEIESGDERVSLWRKKHFIHTYIHTYIHTHIYPQFLNHIKNLKVPKSAMME